jgi:dolichol-phosphate mannosyltransferase
VLFVDDSSPDGTADKIRELSSDYPWVSLLLRRGKRDFSAAYQEGFKDALTRLDLAVIVGMDVDLQHPVSVIPSLVDAIRNGADLAIASRYVEGGGIEGWSLTRRFVSRGANAYARFLLGLNVRDCTSGFKAFSREAADLVARAELHTKRFEYQVATLKLLKGRRIVEVPFIFVSRKAGQSKLGLWDLPRFFFAVARMSLF